MPNDTDDIRIITFSEDTPSLNILGNEPIPVEIIRDVLRDQWNTDHAPRPEIHVLNDTARPADVNLRSSDWVVIDMDSINESQRGFTYEFKDVEIPINIQIKTVVNRQRLYNVMREIARIIYKNNRTLRPFQLIYWDDFVETSEGLKNTWAGECHIRLTSEGVPIFKGFVRGMGSENAPEDQR